MKPWRCCGAAVAALILCSNLAVVEAAGVTEADWLDSSYSYSYSYSYSFSWQLYGDVDFWDDGLVLFSHSYSHSYSHWYSDSNDCSGSELTLLRADGEFAKVRRFNDFYL